jgi:hypothetical protein
VQREGSALRIYCVHNPVPAGYFHRSIEDLSSVRLDALDRRIDIGHAEVDLPVRRAFAISGGLFIMPPIIPCGRLNIWYLPAGPMSSASLGSQPKIS